MKDKIINCIKYAIVFSILFFVASRTLLPMLTEDRYENELENFGEIYLTALNCQRYYRRGKESKLTPIEIIKKAKDKIRKVDGSTFYIRNSNEEAKYIIIVNIEHIRKYLVIENDSSYKWVSKDDIDLDEYLLFE